MQALRMLFRAVGGVALALGLAATASAQDVGFRTLSSSAYSQAAKDGVLVDIREPAEWRETGMPSGALGVSISRPDFVDAVARAAGGDKTRPVAVICRSGTRSLRAAKLLSEAGFTNVTNVGDGMIGRDGVGAGWLAAGLPLQAAPAP